MQWIFVFLFIFSNISCASADGTDFQKSKKWTEAKQMEKNILDSKYVGFTKEDFIKDFGKPKKVLKETSPYPLDANCYAGDCPSGVSDELLVYEFSERTERGITFFTLFVYLKDGKVVRIR